MQYNAVIDMFQKATQVTLIVERFEHYDVSSWNLKFLCHFSDQSFLAVIYLTHVVVFSVVFMLKSMW